MKYQLKLFTALILCMAILLNVTGAIGLSSETSVVAASENSLYVPIIIKERNGIDVKEYFFRRGIALEKGKYFSTENMGLVLDGESITSSVEVLQKHDDGSIQWVLVSGKIDLSANEEIELILTDISPQPRVTGINIEGSGRNTIYSVDGPKVDLIIDNSGISSIKHSGIEKLNSSINQYVTVDGSTYLMDIDKFEVVKKTPAYIKIKVSGNLCENITGVMYITLVEQSERIIIDHHITVTAKTGIESTGLTIGKTANGYEEGEIIDSDYLTLEDVSFASFDNTRFNGATNDKRKTGFVINDGTVYFAPIVNGRNFTYEDGVSRTAQLNIAFENNAEDMAKTLSLPPSVKVDGEQYVAAGEILTTRTGAVVDSLIETLKEDWVNNLGSFYAGALGTYNYNTKTGSINAAMPGEIEYNLGMAYMQTGDEDIFRKMYDMAILRSDVAIYKGSKQECYGIMRARLMEVNTSGTSFDQSHGYYSDEAGLYMTYLLSGDEYIYENFKLCIEKTLSDMTETTTVDGLHVPVSWFIKEEGETPTKSGFFESRGLIRARTLYLASRLFEDDRYKEASDDVVKWAQKVQLPSGAFSQAVFHNGEYLYHDGQTQMPVKDYVMLMGFRGISQLLDYEDNEQALYLTTKVADYLCSQGEEFGSILMHPNSDVSVYEMNEDETRSSRTETNIMAIDVLCTAFEKTEDLRYLEWILKFLDSYIASSVGGIGGGTREQGYRGSLGWSSDNPRVTSLLKTSDNLNKIFENHSKEITQMGYTHLLTLFGDNCVYTGDAENISVPYPQAISNVYESDGGKIIYVYNQYKQDAAEDESWAQTVEIEFDDSSLYQGKENTVNSDSVVSVEQLLEKREYMVLTQRPMYIEIVEGNAKLNIDKYEKQKIQLTFTGNVNATLTIKSGEFPIVSGEKYDVKLTKSGKNITLSVSKGKGVVAENDELVIEINSKNITSDKSGGSGGAGSNWGDGSNPYKKPVEEEIKEEPQDDKKEEPENNPTQSPIEITVSDFNDINKNHWAYEPIMYLKQKDILIGSNNYIRPNDFITRGEAVKIIVLAFDITAEDKTSQFADSQGKWWEEYAAIAAANGIVNGIDADTFDGEGIITREMMAVMIKRAIDYSEMTFEELNGDNNFSDKHKISEYAYDSVNALYRMNLISGMGNGSFSPGEKLTRSQAAQLVFNVITKADTEVCE